MTMSRRCFVAAITCLPAIGSNADPTPPQTPLAWHELAAAQVEGRLWTDEERLRPFDRFPAAAEATVPKPVWNLSRESA
jgi:hypothetical protein